MAKCPICGNPFSETQQGVKYSVPDKIEEAPNANAESYRTKRNSAVVEDFFFFRRRMSEVPMNPNDPYDEKVQDLKREIYGLWEEFQRQKYVVTGRRCPSATYDDCQVWANDPANYPWDRSLLVWEWWETHKPEWFPK